MQYKGYELQLTDEGCIIRDSKGEYITSTSTEKEAEEYIEDIEEEKVDITENPIDWYKRFEQYCKDLPGKCYPIAYEDPNKFGSPSISAINSYAKSFEASTNTTVVIEVYYIGMELFGVVTDVYKN